MAKRAKVRTKAAKAKRAKVARKRTAKKDAGLAARISRAVDIVAGAMRDTQRMRQKAVKKAPMDEG